MHFHFMKNNVLFSLFTKKEFYMQVTTHDFPAYLQYSLGNADGSISLFRRMSRLEATFALDHKSLQGGAMKWISESFIKVASFSNDGVNALKQSSERIIEYKISLANWVILHGASVPQHGAGHGVLQHHHEGIYHADTTQAGPFRNYGVPNVAGLGGVAWFNTLIIDVKIPDRVDYRTANY
jgi:hypothetical protein